MKVEIIKCLKDNYSYLLINEKNKNACVIDPSESKPIIDFVEKKNINLKFILNTHHHYDHVGGNSNLKKKYGSNIVGFKYDKDRIPEIDILVEDNQIWTNEDFQSKIIHILMTKSNIIYNFSSNLLIAGISGLRPLRLRISSTSFSHMVPSLNGSESIKSI